MGGVGDVEYLRSQASWYTFLPRGVVWCGVVRCLLTHETDECRLLSAAEYETMPPLTLSILHALYKLSTVYQNRNELNTLM